jgi:hypothetical protein
MLKNITRLEATVAEKTGHLYLDNDTPIPVVKEILVQFLTFVGNIEVEAKKNLEASEAVKAVDEADLLPVETQVE